MKRVLISIVAVLMLAVVSATGVVMTQTTEVSAASPDCGNSSAFFALRPWYSGLTTVLNGKCEIAAPADGKIPEFVWTIVLNILVDISVLVGYIAIVMVAWGGYLYMFSRGLPERAEKGKKTLIAAFVGLAIAMLASVIMNTIVAILTGTTA